MYLTDGLAFDGDRDGAPDARPATIPVRDGRAGER